MESGGSLLSFVFRRILITVPLLLVISLAVFSLVLLLPGDPALTLAGGAHAKASAVEQIRRQLHLNEGFFTQYWMWLGHALRGDLGHSLFTPASVPSSNVASGIRGRFPVTLSIAVGGMVVAVLIGLPAGIVAGLRPRSWADRIVTAVSSLGVAVPDFWLAMLLVILLAIKAHLLPPLGYTPFSASPSSWFDHLLMPWLALGFGGAATVARQMRGSLIDTLDQDYMRTALAKGLSPSRIVGKHALKNAVSPVVTIVGIQFGYLLGGTFIIENIFSLPGIGAYMITAIGEKDLPVVQGVALLTAVTFVVINLVVDIIYAYLNPKVRLA
ncbi:MAG TPA: ABC transporter permease [Acidimicrobiales bacterium]|nr:ABC transporter permease [Acidimicrobiales bacterium]